MDSAKAQLTDKLKTANNILVTVSRNPSVDQLAACIGLTLLLTKLGKHAAAVFSGQTPSTIEFLKPEDTLEKNTDSLRDFIIALDKSKADKLRYKVEDNVVRIFITPYRTSISQADLEFSQGDFNVDVVIALGVARQEDLDEAITTHGRILHDATVTSINTSPDGGLGSINWHDPQASSLSELVTELARAMGGDLLDNQISTALLTGIVAETARFSNEKTTSQTMSASAALMAAGANQQLVATQLEIPAVTAPPPPGDKPDDSASPAIPPGDQPKPTDGVLDINHDAGNQSGQSDAPTSNDAGISQTDGASTSQPALELPEPEPHESSELPQSDSAKSPYNDRLSTGSGMITEAPSLGGVLTANSQPEDLEPTSDPLSAITPAGSTLLNHNTDTNLPTLTNQTPASPTPRPEPSRPQPFISGLTPPPPAWVPPSNDPFNLGAHETEEPKQTLSELEHLVNSPHIADSDHLDAARDEVSRALSGTPDSPGPIEALNAQPLGGMLHTPDPVVTSDQPGIGYTPQPQPVTSTDLPVLNDPLADVPVTIAPTAPQVTDPSAPPPVPPPIPFQFNPPTQ